MLRRALFGAAPSDYQPLARQVQRRDQESGNAAVKRSCHAPREFQLRIPMLNRVLTLAALSVAASTPIFAQTATTDPVGFVKTAALGLSDTFISAPLLRAPVFAGSVTSSTPTTLGFTAPGFTASQFVYAAGTQPNRYYVLAKGGALKGQFFTITANTTTDVTVDAGGEDLSLLVGQSVQIIPYQTFGTLFPGGAGVNGSSVHGTRNTEVLVPPQTTAGVNLSAQFVYYYFTGASPGWRRVGGGLTTVRNDDIIAPDSYIVIRHNVASSTEVVNTGNVQMTGQRTYLVNVAAATPQDNAVALTVAGDQTLAQSKLWESGAFQGSASHGTRGDELYVYDNAVAALNKSPKYVYYYFTGASPGWRRVGGGLTTVRNDDVVFTAASGFVIRRVARASADASVWAFTPSYVP